MDKDKAVETGDGAAATVTEVKKEGEAASATQDLDLAEALNNALLKLAKVEEDRDNYKTGMLKAKGKIVDDTTDEDDFDTKVARAVQSALLNTEEATAQKERDELTKKVIVENRELKTALANKSQVATSGMGTGSESNLKVGDNVLSDAQIAQFKAWNWSDEKIALFKTNLLKGH